MKILLALLVLQFGIVWNFNPEETNPIIQKLGNDDFRVREETEKKLIEMKIPILYLEEKCKKEPDPEIRTRLTSVISSKYKVNYPNEIPQIWQMNTNFRFPNRYSIREVPVYDFEVLIGNIFGIPIYETRYVFGSVPISYFDIGKIYYDEAAKRITNIEDYRNEEVGRLATTLLIRDLIRSGLYSKKDCEELLNEMTTYKLPPRKYDESIKYPPLPAEENKQNPEEQP